MSSAKMVIHRASSRGFASHGWLESAHSFSFASYLNRERMGYGALRVLNDDTIQPGAGFDTHPHSNMEIISVPLSGRLRHRDSEGNEFVLQAGDIQVMSAGKGISHSEHNASTTEIAALLQIWVIPDRKDTPPAYQQKSFPAEGRQNNFQWIASPDGVGGSLKILQKARLALASAEPGASLLYQRAWPGHGVYFFVIQGAFRAEGERFGPRDAFGIQGTDPVRLEAETGSELLAIEVPLQAAARS